MNDTVVGLVVVFLWFGCAAFAATIAEAKGRGSGRWFFAGLVFGVIGLLAAGLIPDAATEDRNREYAKTKSRTEAKTKIRTEAQAKTKTASTEAPRQTVASYFDTPSRKPRDARERRDPRDP